jgi:hypothetical protein
VNTVHRSDRAYQLTVAGAVGPAIRAAFPAHGFATQPLCTVLVIDGDQERQLDELLELLMAAELTVCEIRRLR